jgi:hypothetical protein
MKIKTILAAALIGALALATTIAHAAGSLPSWNDGKAKQSIVEFVTRVTTPGADFEPPAKRIATFGNDGTLWSEQIVDFRMVGRL